MHATNWRETETNALLECTFLLLKSSGKHSERFYCCAECLLNCTNKWNCFAFFSFFSLILLCHFVVALIKFVDEIISKQNVQPMVSTWVGWARTMYVSKQKCLRFIIKKLNSIYHLTRRCARWMLQNMKLLLTENFCDINNAIFAQFKSFSSALLIKVIKS